MVTYNSSLPGISPGKIDGKEFTIIQWIDVYLLLCTASKPFTCVIQC